MPVILIAILVLGSVSSAGIDSIDIDHIHNLSPTAWQYQRVYDSAEQVYVQIAGVANTEGKGYLAVVCVETGGVELRISAGRYIGTPRRSDPLELEIAGESLALSPQVRVNYFWWPGSEARDLLNYFSRGRVVVARFTIWDLSVHRARFSLDGSVAAIATLERNCSQAARVMPEGSSGLDR